MKVLVTGNRKWRDLEAVKFMLVELQPKKPEKLILVHGRARGADACAHFAAEDMGLSMDDGTIRPYPADWIQHGTAAGPIRNQQMIDEEHQKREPIDICLAFPMRDSIGTWDMVERCLTTGIKVECCTEDKVCLKKFAILKEIHVDPRKKKR